MTAAAIEDAAPGAPEAHAIRLKRLRLRSWRRGMREMDLLLGRFADAQLAGASVETLDAYEDLLLENDQDLYRWMSRKSGLPERHEAIVARIAAFHRID